MAVPVKAAVKILPPVSLEDLPDRYPAKFQPPNLANATVTSLTDVVGVLRVWKNYLDTAEKYYAAALKARLKGATSGEGESFEFEASVTTQERISAEKAREVLTDEQIEAITVTVEMSQMRFRPRTIEIGTAKPDAGAKPIPE